MAHRKRVNSHKPLNKKTAVKVVTSTQMVVRNESNPDLYLDNISVYVTVHIENHIRHTAWRERRDKK